MQDGISAALDLSGENSPVWDKMHVRLSLAIGVSFTTVCTRDVGV